MLAPDAPLVLLMHQGLDNLSGKTGLTLLRYRQGPILAVVDPAQAGRDLAAVTGIQRTVPVVASIPEALAAAPALTAGEGVAVVGLAPSGGRIPEAMRTDLLQALEAGLAIASGLHSRLGDDPELAQRLQPGRWIWDLRQEPPQLGIGAARAAALPGHRLLAVGSDMAVGKMSACLELQQAALAAGRDARFVATGQAGVLIAGRGLALDAVRVDYAAGAVEQAVLQEAAAATAQTLVLVEGQGSFAHPGSTATLPLLRGSQPTGLLLVHRAGQQTIRHLPTVPVPPLPQLIATLEAMAALARPLDAPLPPPRVLAVALNTGHLSPDEARAALEDTTALTGLPCHDPVRQGGGPLLEALLRRLPSP